MYERYQILRDEKGLNDKNVSDKTGIPYTTLRDWARGRYTPKIDKIMKLATYFDVSVEYFLNTDNPSD